MNVAVWKSYVGIVTTMIVYLATTTSAFSQQLAWTQSAWALEIDTLKPIIPSCETNRNPEACATVNEGNTIHNDGVATQAVLKEWAEAEILAIGEWMRNRDYPQAKTWLGNYSGQVPVGTMVFDDIATELAAMILAARRAGETVTPEMRAAIGDSLGSYNGGSGRITLSVAYFLNNVDLDENSATLAHELFHAVQSGANPAADNDPLWIVEGLATAVEYAWLGASATPTDRNPKYDTPLNMPVDEYERGHFFYELGQSLGDDMTYAGQIVKNASDGDGITWLDDYLVSIGMSLAEYYPQFIAEKTNGAMFTQPASSQRDWQVAVPNSELFTLESNSVAAIATGYHWNTLSFSGASGVEEKDRIYLIATEIPMAERMEDLSLVIGEDVRSAHERHLRLVLAQDGSMVPTLVAKVPNVAQTPITSDAQQYDLAVEVSPMSFEMPTCVGVGEDTQIEWLGALVGSEFDQVQGVSFSATAGRVGPDLIYTAPSAPTIAEIHIELMNSRGGADKVLLGEIEVGTNASSTLGHSSSPLIGEYSLDVGATMVRTQAITMAVADPFTIPTANISFVDGGLFLETRFQDQYVSFPLQGETCGSDFSGVGRFATGPAEISLTIVKDSNGARSGTGTIVHRADQGLVTWEIALNPVQ